MTLCRSYSAIIVSNFFLACPRGTEIMTANQRDFRDLTFKQTLIFGGISEVNYLCTNWILGILKAYHTSSSALKYLLQIIIYFSFFLGTLIIVIISRVYLTI